jgi:hypothetical protein
MIGMLDAESFKDIAILPDRLIACRSAIHWIGPGTVQRNQARISVKGQPEQKRYQYNGESSRNHGQGDSDDILFEVKSRKMQTWSIIRGDL